MTHQLDRRAWLKATGAAAGLVTLGQARGDEPMPKQELRLATFRADVTVPIGHALMGGGIAPAAEIADPLETRGVVLAGDDEPVVLVAVDWCEIRNDAHDAWRSALADAVGTQPSRVLVASVHQHDAPVADLAAQQILEEQGAAGSICDRAFHEQAVERVAAAARKAWTAPRQVTDIGTGQGRVEGVASNRRWLSRVGKLAFSRMSATKDADARAADEGTIDPYLKSLSFWDGDEPLAVLHAYATHPMSYYGGGQVSSDFVGLARRRRQSDQPGAMQIYFSGCSGNVTAGKYNDGAPANRAVLAERIYHGMLAAWDATERRPVERLGFRSVPLRLEPRDTPGFTVADLEHRLKTDSKPFGQCLAALGLSWRRRADEGYKLDVPSIDLGNAQVILLPGESYVEYQLRAQAAQPERFVLVIGYGECAPGYIPIEERWREGDSNLGDWCWVAAGSEPAMNEAIRAALASQ